MLTNKYFLTESVSKASTVKNVEDREQGKKSEAQNEGDPAEVPALDSDQTKEAKVDLLNQTLPVDQSEAPEQPADSAEKPEAVAETT